MKFHLKLTSHNSGIALLMTLWVLVLLSVVAMSFSFSTRWGSASTRNFKEETLAHYRAVSGYEDAVAYLLSDKDGVVFIDSDGNFYVDKEKEPLNSKRESEDGNVEIKVTDEESKININSAQPEQLKLLFDYIGMPVDSEQEIVDSILDWIDPDNDHHLSGAEDEYYESLDPPYKAKNRKFDVIEELLLVKSFKPEYMYGSEDIMPLQGLITTTGDSGINLNTASKEVMDLIGMNQIDIDMVMKQRTKEFGGLMQLPAIATKNFRIKNVSNNFRIEVTADMKGSNQSVKIVSIAQKVQTSDGFSFKPVYWRESIESRRG